MSARRYLVVVQDPHGYPANGELEPRPPEGPRQPVIHKALLADDFEAMESRALAAEEREAELRKALLKHGRHLGDCPGAGGPLAFGTCRCGLRAAFREAVAS